MNSVSIVIPVYDLLGDKRLEYFKRLIAIIKCNFVEKNMCELLNEIVVVNDFPDDDIKKAVNNIFVENSLFEKLVLIENTINYGQDKSRNIGFEHTTGNYIHFIDQDDFISDDFYSNCLRYNTDLIISQPNIHLSNTGENNIYLKKLLKKKYAKAKKLIDLYYLLLLNICISPGQYLIKRESFIKAGRFPVLENKGSDDYGLLFKLSFIETRIKYVDSVTFYYCIHESQNRNSINLNMSTNEFFELIKNKLQLKRLKIIIKIRQSKYIQPIFSFILFKLFFYKIKY